MEERIAIRPSHDEDGYDTLASVVVMPLSDEELQALGHIAALVTGERAPEPGELVPDTSTYYTFDNHEFRFNEDGTIHDVGKGAEVLRALPLIVDPRYPISFYCYPRTSVARDESRRADG